MKKLVKVALGAVAFLGITELFCVETVAIMWRKLMMRSFPSSRTNRAGCRAGWTC